MSPKIKELFAPYVKAYHLKRKQLTSRTINIVHTRLTYYVSTICYPRDMSRAMFSFYSPSCATKEVERSTEEDHTTVGLEASYSASFEGASKSSAIQTNSEVAHVEGADETERFGGEGRSGPAEAEAETVSPKGETPFLAKEVEFKGPTATVESCNKIAGQEITKAQGESKESEEQACKPRTDKECSTYADDKQEEHSVFKGDNKVIQSHSYISEVTYESPPILSAASTCSVSTTSNKHETVSRHLASIILERAKAMDNIRNLLKKEREQENGLRTEFANGVKRLEQDLVAKDEEIFDERSKNDDYARQVSRLTSAVDELVESNKENIDRMAELELDVAAKNNAINEMNKDIREKQVSFEKKVDENTALMQQLNTSKAENHDLIASNEDLKTKNSEFANELENPMTSLQELIEQNTGLEAQAEDLICANKKMNDVIVPIKQKNEELLDVVEGLTASLNAAKIHNKNEVDKLKQENEALKKENGQLGETVREITLQMKDQLSNQKEAFEKQVSCLTTSLNDAKASCQKNRKRNDKLQLEIDDVVRKSAKSAEDASATIGQLEKDLEEEFEVTTQLKRGLDDFKKMAHDDDNHDKYTDDIEDMLSLLRMIQCWQLSHFQRINKLVAENEEHTRSVALLS